MRTKEGQVILICLMSFILLAIELSVMGLYVNGQVGEQAVRVTILILAAGLTGILGITVYFAIESFKNRRNASH